MSASSEPIAVIGGGLTGLVAAFTLRRTPPRPEVVLFERAERLGGKIKTEHYGDATVEAGADSFLAREPVVIDLCSALGIAEELVRPAVYGAQVYSRDRLHPLPVGFLRGVPPSVAAARATTLLSAFGAWRTAMDLVWPTPLSGPDISFGSFVRRRFGRQVLDELVTAVMSGTRAGDPDQVSLAAGAPELDAIARRHRSVMRGLQELRKQGRLEKGPPPFRSLQAGMSRVVERLVEHMGSVDIRLETEVQAIESDGERVTVFAGGTKIGASAAIVTIPAPAAARVIGSVAPQAARDLAGIRYATSASIALLYPPGELELPGGSGLLVPAHEQRLLSACTWFSRKWPQLAPAADHEVVRAFVGGAKARRALEATDEELINEAHKDLARMVPMGAAPIDARVDRWSDSLPQYAVGHLDLVDRIEAALADTPVRVAGAGLRGSGIPDCVKQGQRAASEVLKATVGSAT